MDLTTETLLTKIYKTKAEAFSRKQKKHFRTARRMMKYSSSKLNWNYGKTRESNSLRLNTAKVITKI
jgi:hypothetical protein